VNLQRITRIQVLVAGAAIIAGVAIIFSLVLIKPQLQDIAATLDIAEADRAFAAGYNQRVEARDAAQAEEERITAEWDTIMETRMPEIDLSDPIAATLRLWDLPAEEETLMTRWFDSSGAVVTGYSFPTWGTAMPGSFPRSDLKNLNRLDWTLTVQVDSFQDLLEWLKKLPDAPRFMVMHSVTIQGSHGPDDPLVATVPVELWQWTGVEPTGGGATAATTATGAGAAGGAGAAAGGRGGRGGGMRGGRGGGMRGGGMRGGGMRGGGMRGMRGGRGG
jgi:hypothetical protein